MNVDHNLGKTMTQQQIIRF